MIEKYATILGLLIIGFVFGKLFGNHTGYNEAITDLEPMAKFYRQQSQAFVDYLAGQQLTFERLREANVRRLPTHRNKQGKMHHNSDGSDWNIAMWTNAIAGEVGEACNIAKKIMRGDYGEEGSPAYLEAIEELGNEFADIVTYTDLGAFRINKPLALLVKQKFNEVSNRVGSETQL